MDNFLIKQNDGTSSFYLKDINVSNKFLCRKNLNFKN